MVSVPGGRIQVGRADIHEAEAPNPPHELTLVPFNIGVYPVTNREYEAFLNATGTARPPSTLSPEFFEPDRPVVGVSYADALAYCQWAGGDLPTEAQWEYAAGGATSRRYPWGDEPPDDTRAVYARSWSAPPAPVGSVPRGASPFGCHDMAGNVWEWCKDHWRKDAHLFRSEPDGLVTGDLRVHPLRGGCWRSIPSKLQTSYRNWCHAAARHLTIGFRLCAAVRGSGRTTCP